jgi:hypothetical protein
LYSTLRVLGKFLIIAFNQHHNLNNKLSNTVKTQE